MTYQQALAASKGNNQSQLPRLANACKCLSLVHAIDPEMVYKGAVKKNLSSGSLLRMPPVEIGNLQFV